MDSTIELLNQISELNEVSEYMGDQQLTEALNVVAKLILNPDITPGKAPGVIVKLQALSTKFAMLSSYYMNVKKNEVNSKERKNIYYSANAAIDKLVDAIKYLARVND